MTNNNTPNESAGSATATANAAVQAKLDLAIAGYQQGNLEATQALCREIIVMAPLHFDALHLLGLVAAQTGRLAVAIELIGRAVAVNPDNAAAHVNLGNALKLSGRFDQALASYARAIGLEPDYAEAFNNRGNVLQDLGRRAEALADYEQAIRLRPDYPEAHYNRGILLHALQRRDEALAGYQRALQLQPDYAEAHNNLGVLQHELRLFEAALASLRRATALRPYYAEAFNNLGNVLADLGLFDEALASFARAIQLQPDYAEAFNNRGVALQNLKHWTEALASYVRATELKRDYADAHRNEGLCRLLTGDWVAGWDQYEWRWKTVQFSDQRRRFGGSAWGGEFVEGTLLVWSEQGLGDQILYAGMLNDLARCARQLMVCVEPRLVPLLKRSFPTMTIVAQGDLTMDPGCAAETAFGSIGRHLRKSWGDFPADKPAYLRADPLRAAALRGNVVARGRLVCGLSWLSKNAAIGIDKSIRLMDLEPMLGLRAAEFVDLQYGDTRAERAALTAATGLALMHLDEVDNFHDIDGLAALIEACDVIVTVSNTTAHLAGALGKRVFLLLPFSQGLLWYWHDGRTDSPWYPQVRLFRQDRPGDWRNAITQVRDALAGLC